MAKNVCLGLFLICLLASPVYLFPAGLPQPADLVMAFLIAITLSGFIVRPPVHKDLFLVAALFLGHVAVVNLFWWGQYDSQRFILSALYYVFNFGSLLVVMTLVREFGARSVKVCQVVIAIAIAFEIAAVFLLPATTYRAVGTFNNPNQLGYWGLLIGAVWLVLKEDRRLTLFDLAVLGGAGYLASLSLSKAALLSFALLLLLGLVFQGLTRPGKGVLVALGLVGMVVALTDSSAVDRFLSTGLSGKLADRLGEIGQQGDDSLAGRGYDRIWRYPEYLVFGAGEGENARFSTSVSDLDQRELHSTFGTVLFSYGIIGLALFLALLWVVFRHASLAHLLYSSPIWAYGLTHHGLRDTMLWVFLGFVFGLAHYLKPRPVEQVRRPAPVIDLRAPSMSSRLAAASRRR